MKGYKAFNDDLTCRGFQYEIGKEYELEGDLEICKNGFHFCESIEDCYSYYPQDGNTRICEVEALGDVVREENKLATNKIRIIREIPMREAHLNTDDGTSIGYGNTKRGNVGDYNTGGYNVGSFNSGFHNEGCRNAGNRNRGDYNTGDWNAGEHSSGVFCTDEYPKIKMFDKESDWTLMKWRRSKACTIMHSCPSVDGWITEGGVRLVQTNAIKRQEWWDYLPNSAKETIKALPNFDADKFCKCVGIYHI